MTRPVPGGINLAYGAKPYSFAPTNPDGSSFGFAHHGVDLQAPSGTSVKAPEGGKVLFSGLAGTAGYMVQIRGATGVHRLLHNSQLLVSTGQTVSEGQEVAKSGNTGLSTGPHCHWDLAVNGKYVDPMLYINGGTNMSITAGQQDKLIKMAKGSEPSAVELNDTNWRSNAGLAIDTLWEGYGKHYYPRKLAAVDENLKKIGLKVQESKIWDSVKNANPDVTAQNVLDVINSLAQFKADTLANPPKPPAATKLQPGFYEV